MSSVQKIFDEISPTYDFLNHGLSFNIDKSWRKKTVASIQQPPDAPLKILDVCAGTHDLGLLCLKRFPKAQIDAIDFSANMLKVGQKKLERAKATEAIRPQQADALNLPFADNSFDVVMCAYGVRNFADAARGLNEMWRVLKPGGQLLVLEFFRPTRLSARFFNRTYAQFVLPTLGRLISGHPAAYDYLKKSIRGFLSLEEFSELLKKTGFSEISTRSFLLQISSCVSGRKP